MEQSVTVVIPTYNERANLRAIVEQILEAVPASRVIVVDDGSPDGTGALADQLAVETGRVTVIHRLSKSGIGSAYVAGFIQALANPADLIVAMDADGSHAPADLVAMIARAGEVDLVVGSRYVNGGATVGWPLSRRLLSRGGGWYARCVLGSSVRDLTSGFKVYRHEALAALDLNRIRSDGYSFQIETTWRTMRGGYSIGEVPITFHDRIAGKSKLSRRIVLEAMVIVWLLRFDRA